MTTAMKAARPLLPHPLANIFPRADSEVFAAMMESFSQIGWDPKHPIVTYKGMVLDGRNRLYAVEEFNKGKGNPTITPTFEEFQGTEEEAADFAMRENFARRHMTSSQRAGIGLKLRQYFEKRRTGPAHAATNGTAKSTPTERAAKFVSASPRLVARAAELQKMDPKALDRVISGEEKSIGAAISKAKKAAKPASTSDAPDPGATDAASLPMHIKAVHALTIGRKQFTDLMVAVRMARNEAIKLAGTELGRNITANAIGVDFDNIIRVLRYSAPYSSCPMDDPCDDKCGLCKGTQWINEGQFESLPKGRKPKSI